MATNDGKSAKQRIQDRIQAGKIEQRLQRFIFASPTDKDWDKKKMSSSQIRAAQVLLNKVVPDLKAIEWTPPEDWSGDVASIPDEILLGIIARASGGDILAKALGQRKPH